MSGRNPQCLGKWKYQRGIGGIQESITEEVRHHKPMMLVELQDWSASHVESNERFKRFLSFARLVRVWSTGPPSRAE